MLLWEKCAPSRTPQLQPFNQHNTETDIFFPSTNAHWLSGVTGFKTFSPAWRSCQTGSVRARPFREDEKGWFCVTANDSSIRTYLGRRWQSLVRFSRPPPIWPFPRLVRPSRWRQTPRRSSSPAALLAAGDQMVYLHPPHRNAAGCNHLRPSNWILCCESEWLQPSRPSLWITTLFSNSHPSLCLTPPKAATANPVNEPEEKEERGGTKGRNQKQTRQGDKRTSTARVIHGSGSAARADFCLPVLAGNKNQSRGFNGLFNHRQLDIIEDIKVLLKGLGRSSWQWHAGTRGERPTLICSLRSQFQAPGHLHLQEVGAAPALQQNIPFTALGFEKCNCDCTSPLNRCGCVSLHKSNKQAVWTYDKKTRK